MKRLANGTRSAIVMAIVALMASASIVHGAAAPDKALLDLVPGEALFCLRINNLDETLSNASSFMAGIAPDDFDARAMVMGPLPGMLGAERMEQIHEQGSFAIYGTMLAGGQNQGPMGNLFVGVLASVTDYDAFIGEDEPDPNGIVTLTVNGQPKAIATRFGRYTLLAWPHARSQAAQVRQMVDGQKSLGDALSKGERTLSTQSPIWLYGNVQEASAFIKPIISGKLEQIKNELKKSTENQDAPISNPESIIRFYGGLLDAITSETASVAVALAPSAEACTMTLALKAVPGTDMEIMLTPAPQPSNHKRALPYLNDGAILNIAAAVDPVAWEKSYQGWIELIPQLMASDVTEADLDQMRQLTAKSFRAMGKSMSFSFQPGVEDGLPFSMQYVIEVSDGPAVEKAIAEELQLTNSEVFKKILGNFGLHMSAEIVPETTTYKGVKINAAQVTFNSEEDNSPQGQMIQRIWGGKDIQYRWGILDGKCVYTIGSNAEADAHKLIDRIQAGPPAGVCAEMQAALKAIPQGGKTEAIGTLNYVRVLNTFVSGMSLPDGKQLPELNVPTESHVVFAGGTIEDVPVAWVVLPKQHLKEIKSAFQALEEGKK